MLSSQHGIPVGDSRSRHSPPASAPRVARPITSGSLCKLATPVASVQALPSPSPVLVAWSQRKPSRASVSPRSSHPAASLQSQGCPSSLPSAQAVPARLGHCLAFCVLSPRSAFTRLSLAARTRLVTLGVAVARSTQAVPVYLAVSCPWLPHCVLVTSHPSPALLCSTTLPRADII